MQPAYGLLGIDGGLAFIRPPTQSVRAPLPERVAGLYRV